MDFAELQKRKVVYNSCFGGFCLSKEAILRGRELSGNPEWGSLRFGYISDDIPRHDPVLVQVVEELGNKASGTHANLCVAEVSGKYRIDEYDGAETVMEPADYDWVD